MYQQAVDDADVEVDLDLAVWGWPLTSWSCLGLGGLRLALTSLLFVIDWNSLPLVESVSLCGLLCNCLTLLVCVTHLKTKFQYPLICFSILTLIYTCKSITVLRFNNIHYITIFTLRFNYIHDVFLAIIS